MSESEKPDGAPDEAASDRCCLQNRWDSDDLLRRATAAETEIPVWEADAVSGNGRFMTGGVIVFDSLPDSIMEKQCCVCFRSAGQMRETCRAVCARCAIDLGGVPDAAAERKH